jgi:hypothetical protein
MTLAHLGDSGIVLGEVDAEGVLWTWSGDDPWSPSPAPREQAGDRENGHGQWDATRFYGPRSLALTGMAKGDHEALHRAKHRLMAAVSVQPFTLLVDEPAYGTRQATVRRGAEVLWTEDTPDKAVWSLALYQPDPFIYSTTTHTQSTNLPASSGGLTWPATWPATWDAVVTSGRMGLHNAGTVDAYPVFRVFGPLPDFTLVRQDTGAVLTVSNPDGQTLGSGEYLDVDTKRRRVLLMGTGSRRSWMSGDWFALPPGTTDVGFTASVPNTTASVTATWADTWI